MKSAFLFLFCFFTLLSPQISFSKDKKKVSNSVKNTLNDEHLHGKVKSISEQVYDILNGKNNLLDNACKYFNENGYIYLINTYGKDSSIVDQIKFFYDEHPYLTGTLDSSLQGPVTFTLFKNDIEGNDTAKADFKRGSKGPELISYTRMKYSNIGVMIESKEYDQKDSFKSKTRSIYDSKRNLIEYSFYTSDTTLKERYVYKYDKEGNKIETYNYDKNGILKNKYNYEYKNLDVNGNWQTFIRYQEGKAQFSAIRKIEYYN